MEPTTPASLQIVRVRPLAVRIRENVPSVILLRRIFLGPPRSSAQGVKKVVLVSSVASIHAGWDTPCQGVIMEPEKRWSVPEK